MWQRWRWRQEVIATDRPTPRCACVGMGRAAGLAIRTRCAKSLLFECPSREQTHMWLRHPTHTSRCHYKHSQRPPGDTSIAHQDERQPPGVAAPWKPVQLAPESLHFAPDTFPLEAPRGTPVGVHLAPDPQVVSRSSAAASLRASAAAHKRSPTVTSPAFVQNGTAMRRVRLLVGRRKARAFPAVTA